MRWLLVPTSRRGGSRRLIAPSLGFLFCLVIFLGLQGSTLVAGGIWVAVGALYVVLKTKAMGQPVVIDFSES
jgi:hypothetical protein